METIIAAICEDDSTMREHILTRITECFQACRIQPVIMSYVNAKELSAAMEHMTFSLLFLDIDLPGMDGISFATQLRALGNSAAIVFISNLEERVYDVFRVHPWSFVRKSWFDDEIGGVIQAYVRAMENTVPQIILHDADGRAQVVQPDTLIYVESAGKLQELYLQTAEAPLSVRSSLRELEQQLSPMGFIRIHKGFLVNYRAIQKITSRTVVLDGGQILPLGRDRLQQTRERYLLLMKWKGAPQA